MANEMTGMWGATDLNDLIRGLKMMIAQAEDVRACGGTLADLQPIGTCGTCSKNSPILCNDDSDHCEGCTDNCYECNDYWGNDEDEEDWDNEEEKPTLEKIAQQLQNIIADLDYLDY